MHELALAESIVQIVEEQAARDHFARVVRVRLAVGALAHVEPSALVFGFEAAAKGSIAEGAELAIDTHPARAHCLGCAREVDVKARGEACPTCGQAQWIATQGDDLRVTELEVE